MRCLRETASFLPSKRVNQLKTLTLNILLTKTSMKYLLEISKIVTKKKVKKIEIFDDNYLKQKKTKFHEFYDALMSGDLDSDAEAATLLYNSTPTHDKYRQLKSRFKKRLLNTLFFLDVNQAATSNYNRAYYSCNKDWTLAKILLSHEANLTANQITRHIFMIALKFEFADIIVNATRILREQAALEGNEKLFDEYNEHNLHYQKVLSAEMESEAILQRAIMIAEKYKRQSDAPEVTEKMDTYKNALDAVSSSFSSPIIAYNQFMLHMLEAELKQDYQMLYETCNRAENYIAKNPQYYREGKMAQIALKKLIALYHLEDFDQGEEHAERYLVAFEKNKLWFELVEYYLLMAIRSKKYDLAHQIFDRLYEDKRYKKMSNETKEKWFVFEVYLCYLAGFDKMTKPKKYKQFRVKRFLEEPIIYTKKQRIFTVILVIAQTLFLFEEQRYGEAFERIERLKGYSNKFLKLNEHFRVVQFIRLLQQLAKAHFNYENIGVHQKYVDKLEQTPIRYKGNINELEIIPYHHLWEMVLQATATPADA